MDFNIEATNCFDFSDFELSELLSDVYVGDGYVETELAETLFDANSVLGGESLLLLVLKVSV